MHIALALLAVVAVFEVAADLYQRATVPTEDDWSALASHVDAHWQEGDVVLVGTDWARPLVRQYLGRHMKHGSTARSDLQGFSRAWSVWVGGGLLSKLESARLVEQTAFGNLTLRLYELPAEGTLVNDLVEEFSEAKVVAGTTGPKCNVQRAGPSGGGLGRGPIRPAVSWSCPGQREWIGRTTIEDLDYQPRRCIWQRAKTRNPTRVTFDTVGPAERLVLHAGHYLRDERKEDGPPVVLNVYVDGALAGQMTHRDGDGWKRFELGLPPQQTASVSVEPVATTRDQNFCWAAKALRKPQ